MTQELATTKASPLASMAARLELDPDEMESVITATVMPSGKVSREQFTAFVAVANSYKLDPLKKEIYAFPAKTGGIQPVVSIDGWLNIIHNHEDFDGMELSEHFESGEIFSITCTIYRKSQSHPTVITEYLSECKRNTDTWKRPIRMLRHKATIQAARYAFGLSGIMEQDEYEAAQERDITPARPAAKVTALKRPEPAPDKSEDIDAMVGDIRHRFEHAKTSAELEQVGKLITRIAISQELRDELREAYAARKKALDEGLKS